VLDRVREIFDYKEVDAHRGFYFVTSLKDPKNKVKMTADALKINNNLNQGNFNQIRNEIMAYIPAALLPYIQIDEERWSSELRKLTIMFVNLGIDLSDAKTSEGLQ
jgi:adenylate cyclase 10